MVAPFIFLLKEIYQFAPVKHDMRVCLLRRGKMYLPVSLVNVEEVYGGRPSWWHILRPIFSLFVQAAAARTHVCIDADPGYNITQRGFNLPAKMTISKLPASPYDILRVQSTGEKKTFFLFPTRKNSAPKNNVWT